MNVRELIERLGDFDPDADVLLAIQPDWPLQFELAGLTSSEDLPASEEPCEAHEAWACQECEPEEWEVVVYLVQGDHPGDEAYAPREAWAAAL